MKTLIIYNDLGWMPQYLIVDGDYSRFNGIVVNSGEGHQHESEFIEWMFNPETGERNSTNWSTDTSLIENKAWDKVALCTFLP
jgi:hypothetical protein